MTMTLKVPPEIEAALRQRAAASGESIDACALNILREAVAVLDEALDWNPAPPLRSQTSDGTIEERRQGTPIPYEPQDVGLPSAIPAFK